MILNPIASTRWADDFFDEGFRETFTMLGAYRKTESDADALVELLRLPAGARILDIPCGFGRHVGPLTRHGYEVIGVDNSPTQIQDARSRHPDGAFFLADMCDPPPGPYSAVLNLWTSFGFLDTAADDLMALSAWAEVLAPSGNLVMEIDTLERFEHQARRDNEAVSVTRTQQSDLTGMARFDWTTQMLHTRWSRPGWTRLGRLRMHSLPQLDTALRHAGFRDITFFSDFCGNPATPTDRTVVIATK